MSDRSDIFYKSNASDGYPAIFKYHIGGRGIGKSFNFKLRAVKADWTQTLHQTIWVRRRQTDIEKLLENDGTKFLADLYAEGKITWEEDEWKLESDTLYHYGHPIIFFIPLSMAEQYKSLSFYHVKDIVFDEVFTNESGAGRGYLRGEVEKLLDLYETVNRLRGVGGDTRKDVVVHMLANNVSWVNPHFNYWGIKPFDTRFKTYKDGSILVENIDSKDFAALKKQTAFGKLIAGTTYGDYAIDNIAWQDSDALICKRTPRATLRFNIRYKDRWMGIWSDGDLVFCCTDHNRDHVTYALRFETTEHEIPLTRGEPLKTIIKLFNVNRVRFENGTIKDDMFTIMQTGGNGR